MIYMRAWSMSWLHNLEYSFAEESELKKTLTLIHGNHMPRREYSHKREVAASFEFTSLLVVSELQILCLGLVKGLLPRPLESFSPSLVSKPVTDEIPNKQ